MSNVLRIAVIAGDGIGREVIPPGLMCSARQYGRVAHARIHGVPVGCDFYRRTGRMMDANGLDTLQGFDAIYLGAIGESVGS